MQLESEQIFLEKKKSVASVQHTVRLSNNLQNQNDYLNQFISYQTSANFKFDQENRQPNRNNSIVEENQSSSKNQSWNGSDSDKKSCSKKRQKSQFHNFQKHLVITLRNIIKIRKTCYQKEETQFIGYQMWEIFKSSTFFSKKFLFVLFGVYGLDQQNQFSKGFLNSLGFMQIFAKYQQEFIRQAQKYLRRQIINQLESLNLKNHLQYRKLKRVEQFQKYMKQFICELKEGSIRKRLPKQRKISMKPLKKQLETSNSI